MMHNCSYIVPWHKPQSFFSWQTTIYSSISVFKRWIFRGIFGTGLWQQLTVKPIKHFVFIFLQLLFFDIYFVAILDQHASHRAVALFLSLVSLFANNSNNNNSNNNNSLKLIHKIKTTYVMLQNFQFKLSEVKINTELLFTILHEHLI